MGTMRGMEVIAGFASFDSHDLNAELKRKEGSMRAKYVQTPRLDAEGHEGPGSVPGNIHDKILSQPPSWSHCVL